MMMNEHYDGSHCNALVQDDIIKASNDDSGDVIDKMHMKKLMQDDIIISLNDDSGAVVDKMTTTNFIDKMYMN